MFSQQRGSMEVTALCIRLWMKVLMLLVAQVHLNCSQESASPLIVPSRLQLFEYSSITFDCAGFRAAAGWTVMRNVKGSVGECVTTWAAAAAAASACAIKPAYSTDSGKYWCEAGDEKSNVVNITITAGAVILESPAVPVMEGEAVTLRCRSKMTSSAHIADFFRDDIFIGSGSTGDMTIQRIPKAHEGFYKCRISDFGDSAESWLAVTGLPRDTEPPPSAHSCHSYLVLRAVFTVLMVALLLVLVGLLHFGKIRITQTNVCICEVCKGHCRTQLNRQGDEKEGLIEGEADPQGSLAAIKGSKTEN